MISKSDAHAVLGGVVFAPDGLELFDEHERGPVRFPAFRSGTAVAHGIGRAYERLLDAETAVRRLVTTPIQVADRQTIDGEDVPPPSGKRRRKLMIEPERHTATIG